MIFYNAKIITMDSNPIKNGYIKTKNNRIVEIDDVKRLDNVEENKIDLKGMWVYPGFIDAHSHMGMFEEIEQKNTPTFNTIYSINPNEKIFKQALKAGITTAVISPGSSAPVTGDIVAVKTHGKRLDDMIIKDSIGIKFALGENPKNFEIKTRAEIVEIIRKNLIEAEMFVGQPEYKYRIYERLLKGDIKAYFHCHRQDDIFSAMRVADEFNLDAVFMHATQGYTIKKHLKGRNLILGPLFTDISKQELKKLNIKAASKLEKSGINFAICSDYPEFLPQYLLISIGVAIREGLSRNKALRAITIDAAKICGIDDRVGSLKKGKDCDFVGYKRKEDIFNVYAKPEIVVVDSKIVYKK